MINQTQVMIEVEEMKLSTIQKFQNLIFVIITMLRTTIDHAEDLNLVIPK